MLLLPRRLLCQTALDLKGLHCDETIRQARCHSRAKFRFRKFARHLGRIVRRYGAWRAKNEIHGRSSALAITPGAQEAATRRLTAPGSPQRNRPLCYCPNGIIPCWDRAVTRLMASSCHRYQRPLHTLAAPHSDQRSSTNRGMGAYKLRPALVYSSQAR